MAEHIKTRIGKVQLMRERAAERMQIARKILHGVRIMELTNTCMFVNFLLL